MTPVQKHTLAHSTLVYLVVPPHDSHLLDMPGFPPVVYWNLCGKHALVGSHTFDRSWNPDLVLLYTDPDLHDCRCKLAGFDQTKNNLMMDIAPVSPPYYMQLGLGKMRR